MTRSDVIIKVEGLGKRYQLAGSRARYSTLRESVSATFASAFGRLAPGRTKPQDFWALQDICFEVERGEVVGVIGRNGAGKSTLLKILSRITAPSTGYVDCGGRVGSLLEVGTGFHPELSGRENIYLNGAILGMSRRETQRKFDEIVDFAEIGRFLDTPVKRYSSGMYMRLAFAVAAHLEPDILLVDEVLAVGDAAFQKKCLGKMGDVAKQGRTVLFVSHNMGAVASLCSRAIELSAGKVAAVGPAPEIVRHYLARGFHRRPEGIAHLRQPGMGAEVRFVDVDLANEDGSTEVPFGSPVRFELMVQSSERFASLSIGCSIFTFEGNCVGTLFTNESFSLEAGEGKNVSLSIRRLDLAPGLYYAGFSIGKGGQRGSGRHDLDIVIGQPAFQIIPGSDSGEAANWNSGWGSIVIRDVSLTLEGASS